MVVVVGGCWWLLMVVGGCWWLLVVVGGSWWLLVVVGGCWWLLGSTNSSLILKVAVGPTFSGWWFGTFFIFPYIGNKSSQLTFIFFRGLKPPTSFERQVLVVSPNGVNTPGCAVKFQLALPQHL